MIKSHTEVTKQLVSMYFLLFCLMIKGSGAGSASRTNGSGSGRPKYGNYVSSPAALLFWKLWSQKRSKRL